ncbi:MAG: phosphopantothenoylcysteine decarboxylase, partial [Bacteroidales bacterium]|nr:phosphopantothenoylcysteine decarboxylase [Bacteroidales bacterium]
DIKPKHANIHLVNVESAQEMYNECIKHFPKCDAAIMSAAVADYAPEKPATEKIKRQPGQNMVLNLVPNPDIAAQLGKIKTDKQILAGFALETENEQYNAQKKLESKNLDFIVLNSLNDKGAGFGFDTNKISIVYRSGKSESFALKPKTEVAKDIAAALLHLLN